METFLMCCIILILSILLISRHTKRHKSFKNLPPGPPALPVIGHLHLLKTGPHRALQALSKKHGPLMFLRLGCRPVLIVSSPSVAEECFSRNDIIFANRPESIANKILGYDYTTIGFSSYGDHWKNLRRLMNIQLFSSTSIQRMSLIGGQEVHVLVKKMLQGSESKVNLKSLFFELVYNVGMMTVCGKRGPVMEHMFGPMKILDVCDFLPFLGWIGFQGIERSLEDLQKKRDSFLQGLVDEARKQRVDSCNLAEGKETYIQTLLSMQIAEPEYYTDDILKGLILPMFTAGAHTIAVTLEWAMVLLLDNPHELQKVQKEIDDNVKPGKFIEETDLPNLPFLRCVVVETLRLCPVGPLLIPHSTSQDCTIKGYDIPNGTIVLVNVWAMHRDPNLWEDPTTFKPERFIECDGIVDPYKVMTFGMGRRACPGSVMATRLLSLALGALIQCFDWERISPYPMDLDLELEQVTGLTLSKIKPLEAFYRPRSSIMSVLGQV